MADYKNIYLQTAKEYLGKLSVSLEQLSIDVSNKNALNNLHIASHSLKSQSQVMGFADVADICLKIEKVSDDALKGNTQLNFEIVSDMKKSTEKLKEILLPALGDQDDVGSKI
ncbi:MAG: HPt protein [Candidatus Levybacteria bacterium]|nr:HPt protein [Candidatus Levybacteria bacterium]